LGEQGSPVISHPSVLSAPNAFATARIASASDAAAAPAESATRVRRTVAHHRPPAPWRRRRGAVEAVGDGIAPEREREFGEERGGEKREKQELSFGW
jgi:hypothetical protein